MSPTTVPERIRRAALTALIRLTPATSRHQLIDETAKALRDYPHPTAPTTCACGHAMRATTDSQVEPESYELDYSVGWQPATHTHHSDGFAWWVVTRTNDQHTVCAMCAGCQRLYTIPDTEEINYG